MVNVKLCLVVFAQGVEGQSKTYGPVFTRLVAQESTKFVAEKLKEEPPKVETLREAIDYIMQKLDKYPKAYGALAYGVSKVISTLEGTVGSGAKIFSASFFKPLMIKNGLDKILGHCSGTLEAVQKYWKFSEEMGLTDKGVISPSQGGGNVVICKVTGCDCADACTRIIKEGIVRTIGGTACSYGMASTTASEIGTHAQHDYKVIRVEPPQCEFRVQRQNN